MITDSLKKVAAGQDLSYDEAYACMDEIFSGEVSEAVTAGYLTALHMNYCQCKGNAQSRRGTSS